MLSWLPVGVYKSVIKVCIFTQLRPIHTLLNLYRYSYHPWCEWTFILINAVWLCVWGHFAGSFFRTDTLWRVWRHCYHRHEHGGMKTLLSLLLITWMSMCVICLFLSAWSVGEGVCPYCVTAGHTPWLVETQWQVVPQGEAHVTGEEIMLWWSSICVCAFFPVCPCWAFSSGGPPGPAMRGASMVLPTHWSQGKTTHP